MILAYQEEVIFMIKARKRVILCVLFCIVAIAALLIYNIPIHISKTHQAMEFNLADETHAIPRQVSCNGYYRVNLFAPDTFSGLITVSGYDYANGEYKMNDVEIASKSSDLAHNNITYDNPINEDARDDYLFAEIYSDTFRQKFALILFEDGGYNTADATFIVTGMDNRENAVKWIETIFFGHNG